MIPPSDSLEVESKTGWFIATLSVWCWLFDWFGGWFPNLAGLHGLEVWVAVVGIPYGLWQTLGPYYERDSTLRKWRCLGASWWFGALGTFVYLNRGLEAPGVPACYVATMTQGWCYLKLSRVI